MYYLIIRLFISVDLTWQLSMTSEDGRVGTLLTETTSFLTCRAIVGYVKKQHEHSRKYLFQNIKETLESSKYH